MPERISLDLELGDKVSGPAKAAAAALTKIDQASKSSTKELDKLGAAFAKIGVKAEGDKIKAANKALENEDKQRRKFADVWAKIGNKAFASEDRQRRKFADAWAKIGMKAESDKLKAAKASAKAGADEYKQMMANVDRFASGVKSGIGSGAMLAIGIGAAMTAGAAAAVGIWSHGVKEAFKEGIQYENLKLSYKLAMGNEATGALSDIGRFSGQAGLDDDEIAAAMRPLFLAGLRGQAARSAFSAAQDLAAASGDGSKPQEFIDLLTKIQLKGGISEKQLIGLGLSGKVFKEALAKETGLGKEAAAKKAESGKMDPQHILNAIYAAIETRQGGKLGSGGDAYGKTMGAQLHMLSQLPSNYLKMVQESDAWPKMTEQVKQLLEGLSPDSPRGKQIIGSLSDGFLRLTAMAERALTPENITKFTDAVLVGVDLIGKIPDVIGKVADVAGTLKGVMESLGIDLSPGHAVSGGDTEAGRRAALVAEDAQHRANITAASQPSLHRVAAASAMRGAITITGNKTEVQIFPAKDDVEHSKKEAGQALASTLNGQLERSAQEGGGG